MPQSVARWLGFVVAVACSAAVVAVAARHVTDRASSRRVSGLRLLGVRDVEVDLPTSISHPTRLESAGVNFAAGWTRAGKWGLWAVAPSATIEMLFDEPRDRNLTLDCRAYPGLKGVADQVVTFELNGVALGRRPLGRSWDRVVLALPATAQRAGVNQLVLHFAATVRPREQDAAAVGARPTAIGVRGLTLTGGGRGGVAARPLGQAVTSGQGSGGGRTPWVRIEGSGTLVAPLELTGKERWLEVAVRRSSRRSRSRATVQPWGAAGRGLELRPEPLELPPGVGSARHRYPLAGLGGGLVAATFQVVSDGAVEIALHTVGGDTTPALTQQPPPAGVTRPPDIVVLILDAARRDHFGCYGYRRPTTPRIDRLARQSVVFSQVFALAPYTLCSVPTMLTGTSFVSHGVVDHADRLAASAVSLAEVLAERGYQTAAFSASPNDSRAKGFDQGFEHFFESWQNPVKGAKPRDPFRLTEEVLGWLRERADDRPLFLWVHYIPPHEPYDPEPRFDIFSKPDYHGPIDGWFPTLKAIDVGELIPTAADLRHVADLYDGNLLRADAALRPLLRALEMRRRWPDTAVLVTSDHGEALFEHGRATHNSTLYDEMLEVPFILRLPDDRQPAGIRLERLASLADLAPTLAGLAGASMPSASDGLDLLAPGDERPNRYLLARTAGNLPQYGVRTGRWKAILSPAGSGELYDLRRDPRERRNEMLARFSLFSAFEACANRVLNAPRVVAVAERRDALGDAEREMLRELGYVE